MKNPDTNNEVAIARSGITNKLVEINELLDLLGYTDERSIETWCKKNKIPLFQLGKKTYTIRIFIDLFFSKKMEEYVKATFKNADGILKAIADDNKLELSKFINEPLDKKVERKFKKAQTARLRLIL